MALTEEQYREIKRELDECKRPLFFFDDDQDGLCSFLLLYRYKREGKGIIVKTSPRLDENFARKANDYQPDKIFVLDIAVLLDEFVDNVKAPIVWIDHHGPSSMKNGKIKYFNPKITNKEDNFPTSYLCYNTVKQDIWIATLGCVADWYLPDFLENFIKNYPGYIEGEHKNPGDVIYTTKLGKLIRMLSFILKGKMEDVKKTIKIMTRIEHPDEILEKTTEQGKFIYKRFTLINREFEPLMDSALEEAKKPDDDFIIFTYGGDQTSFTSDICNELTYRYPEKVVLVCREKSGEMRCSLRSTKHSLPEVLEKSLMGLQGYGGGHKNACGLNVIKEHFDEFLENLRKNTDIKSSNSG